MNNVPNVNFFINYVLSMKGRNSSDEYLKEHLAERRFYSGNQDDDYVKYIIKGSNEKLDYVEYSGNHEKSHGVFNENGMMKSDDIKELRQQLRTTESPIWHGVISFEEEFGHTYCSSTEVAYNYLKRELPKFFKHAGLNPDNIIWYAGLHENTDNNHIHISFFEKAPIRQKERSKKLHYSDGLIPIKAINKFKVSSEIALLKLTDDVILTRKTLTHEMKMRLKLGEFMNNINSLMYVIPKERRIAYDSENIKPYKSQIDMVVNSIIRANKDLQKKFNDFESFLVKRDNEIKRAYDKIKVDYSDKLLHDKCMEDIYKRLGNIVLQTVKDIRTSQQKVEYETTQRLALKRIEKNKKKILLNRCVRLNELVDREIVNAFQEYREKLEIADYKRLQEEGYIDWE